MRILYVSMKYNYGRPDEGFDYGHYNFYNTLLNMGHEVLYYDYMTRVQRHGKQWLNEDLPKVAKKEKPDLMFVVLFEDQFEMDTMRKISESGDTVTVNWFADDQWRWEKFTRLWAPCFNWSITTAHTALPKYASIGYKNVILTQYAVNHILYRRLDLPLKHDVTFVGLPHGDRRDTVKAIRKADIDIKCWGNGWELGSISQDEMMNVFNQSKVNLNLSNVSVKKGGIIGKLGTLFGGDGGAAPVRTDQIKGRNFEVPGCGGFLLTQKVENLGDYYVEGKEIATFTDQKDLVEKVMYYLSHEEERAAIARAGYERTIKEHTYVHRFNAVFKAMGLPTTDMKDLKEGTTHEFD